MTQVIAPPRAVAQALLLSVPGVAARATSGSDEMIHLDDWFQFLGFMDFGAPEGRR